MELQSSFPSLLCQRPTISLVTPGAFTSGLRKKALRNIDMSKKDQRFGNETFLKTEQAAVCIKSVSSDFFVYSHCAGNGSSMFQPFKEPGASHHLHSVPQNLWLLSLDSITCIHLHGWRLMELGQEGLKPPEKLVVPCPRHNITVTRIQGD